MHGEKNEATDVPMWRLRTAAAPRAVGLLTAHGRAVLLARHGMPAMSARYQGIRIRAGDYLQVSDDGTGLYRVTSYQEHGDLEIGTDKGWRVVRGTFWRVCRYRRPFTEATAEHPDLLEWDEWDCIEDALPTKREAVAIAAKG